MKQKKINSKGFTLIEIIIALSIVSIVSIAFYTVINSSIKNNVKNEKDIKSLNIAQSELESLRREIKSNNSTTGTSVTQNPINIYDNNGNILISIFESPDIKWEAQLGSNIQNIKIIETKSDGTPGIYKNYISTKADGTKDSSTLQYVRMLDTNDTTEYIIKLKLTRELKFNKKDYKKYIYNIAVEVNASKFSNKKTILSTSILSN